MTTKANSSKENIEAIDWIEHIRSRPGMYLGSMNNRGFVGMLKYILSEIILNAKPDFIVIELHGQSRGELRFENIKNTVNDSLGVALKKAGRVFYEMQALNALSSHFQIRFFDSKGNKVLKQCFEKGKTIDGSIKNIELSCDIIEIEFSLDREIWKNEFEWNENYIDHEIRDYAYLHKRVKFEVRYKIDNEQCNVIYHFKNGLKDRLDIEKLNGLGGSYFQIFFEEKINDFAIEAAFAFKEYSVDEAFLKSYVNDSYTYENGTHVDGLLKGLIRGIIKYFQKNKLLDGLEISEDEIKEDLIAAIHVKIKEPVFCGSVKNKLANPEIVEPIANYIAKLFFEKMMEDETSAKKLTKKIEQIRWVAKRKNSR
ncbi:MAG TPA: hypothetical protein ENJ95_01980 [Bacteroidetes bacterium]|nr:hypothetical protein [Bacteroidota bacterium]